MHLHVVAVSVLQVRFDVVCLFTFLESQVDRSYLYLVGHNVALHVRSISSFSMVVTVFRRTVDLIQNLLAHNHLKPKWNFR